MRSKTEKETAARRRQADLAALERPQNLAARVASWSAGHRKSAIWGWFLLVAILFGISLAAPMKTIVFETSGPGESGRADSILYEDFDQPAGEVVLVESTTSTWGDPEFDSVIRAVVQAVSNVDAVADVESPLDLGSEGLVSEDERSALVQLEIAGPAEDASDKIDAVVQAVAETQQAHPDFYVGSFGESTGKALQDSFADDLKDAGLYSIPLTLLILLVAFGALVAAGIPMLLGLSAVLGTFGIISLVSQALPMSDSVSAIVLLIGLAVGVDYSLFYLKREREERDRGLGEAAALQAAAATSGRAILVSGLTVIVAMSGMFITGDADFASFGVATIAVVAMAMIGSLTVLPALLSTLGDKVNRGRIPLLHRLRGRRTSQAWSRIVDRVLKKPALSATIAGGLLVAVAVPALQMQTAQPGIDTYPQSLLTTYNKMQAAFPGTQVTADVVVRAADVEAEAVQAAIADLKEDALATGLMNEPISTDVNAEGTVVRIAIPVDGDGSDSASNEALDALRDDIIPPTLGAVDGAEAAVTGFTANSRDFDEQMKSVTPLVFGFVLLLAFLLMLVFFRSVVIALKAVVLNILSIGAAYGVLVLVFQHGWGKDVLGFESTGGIDPFLPILLFVILFGLSMDYHIFIVSRIKESVDAGMDTTAAIAHGIKSTAGVVTSAAIVMVAVFAIFGALQAMIFKQFGVGLAVAILIDATIVRAILLPASMKLLGKWNWYLPTWLQWMPHVHTETPSKPPVEQERVPEPLSAG